MRPLRKAHALGKSARARRSWTGSLRLAHPDRAIAPGQAAPDIARRAAAATVRLATAPSVG
jgi:hypothetical protein